MEFMLIDNDNMGTLANSKTLKMLHLSMEFEGFHEFLVEV